MLSSPVVLYIHVHCTCFFDFCHCHPYVHPLKLLFTVVRHVCTHYRVYLDQLESPDDAVRVVKQSESIEGAKMVAW